MNGNSDYKELLYWFNRNQVKYLVIGAYAVIYYVEPRFTRDLDIWVQPSQENAAAVFKALSEFGAPLEQLNITPQDFERPGQFVQIGMLPGNKVDIHLSVRGFEDFDSAWKDRVEGEYEGERILLLSKEHLIRSKEAAGRPQDHIDVKRLRDTLKWDRVAAKKKPVS